MNRTIFFGPPGTGKTTTLLQKLEEHLTAGVPPERIAFLTFTRRAKREAVERVEKVLGIKARDLPHFRTIHSMAFRALALKEGDVVGREQLNEFGAGMGLQFGAISASEQAAEGISSQDRGDVLLALDNLARVRGESLRKTWGDARTNIEWPVVEQFSASYAKWKHNQGLLDFTDVLAECARQKKTVDVDVAFIDEAQDLSKLQWYAALQAVQGAPIQYVAGDDDQAIYRWAGADVQSFMSLTGDRRVLGHSYRLPRAVHGLAQRLATRIKQRVPKQFTAREEQGSIVQHASAESLQVGAGEQWLWLVRNRYLLGNLQRALELQGVVYSQHGTSSIYEKERAAIYTWERLRAGKPQTVHAVRDLYSFLLTRSQVAHGHKLLPGIEEDAHLSEARLRAKHGLLAQGVWFEVLQKIPEHRRSYYRRLLRDHQTLKLAPQVQLETIHGAKGAEAPHVALFLEQSRRVWDEAQQAPDDEHRVFYVGATRAREQLHIVQPGGRWGYAI
jgi:superfamily I DNA/RNA helicase